MKESQIGATGRRLFYDELEANQSITGLLERNQKRRLSNRRPSPTRHPDHNGKRSPVSDSDVRCPGYFYAPAARTRRARGRQKSAEYPVSGFGCAFRAACGCYPHPPCRTGEYAVDARAGWGMVCENSEAMLFAGACGLGRTILASYLANRGVWLAKRYGELLSCNAACISTAKKSMGIPAFSVFPPCPAFSGSTACACFSFVTTGADSP